MSFVGDARRGDNLITPINYAHQLKIWNWIAVAVNGISFVALTIITLASLCKARHVNLWLDVANGTVIRSLGSYPLFATLLPFPFITAVFHAIALFTFRSYSTEVLQFGQNRLRWIEYSITNGLMTFSLLALAGGGNVVVLVVNVLANIVMQYFGYLHEDLNHTKPDKATPRRTLRYLLVGFVPWLQIWLSVLTYFGVNFGSATTSDKVAILGSLFISLLFVLPLLLFKGRTLSENFQAERLYIILSFTAKLFLDWTIVGGTLAEAAPCV